ncbi:heavy-metal-associated domain-containing protein [Flavobacterium sp.]|uniref:heavy-metal-associated domain-containing protein n=1 Tax=Flavobacterium sp. TaxID=239 RepID=UPI003D111F73
MKRIILILMLMIGLSTVAQEKKNKNAKFDIEVNGNCGMCKKRIETAAYSVKGVKSAQWNSEDGVLHLMLNEEKCTLSEVEKAIAKVGHDTKNVKATQADYDNLHGCCQYERK